MGQNPEENVGSASEEAPQKSLVKKVFHKGLQVVLGFHLFTQANYCYQGDQDPEQRREFEKEFGFSVQGFPENVEGTEGNLSKIAAAVHKERLEKDFELSAIRISSDDYVRKSIFGQLEYIIIKGGEAYDGINYPFMGRIYLDDTFLSSTVHHEIKHAKTDYLLRNHPEFKTKWLALASDDEGEPLYSGYSGWVFSRVRLIGDFVKVHSPAVAENERLGFISGYSRIHYYEDVAVLSEQAEVDYYVDDFIDRLYDVKNEKIISKVNLAQEYSLIPKEFTEYIWVRKKFKEHQELLEVTLDEAFKVSDEFLSKHPNTAYEIMLRKIRGDLLDLKGRCEEAIIEYRQGLTSAYKDHNIYPVLLDHLSSCYKRIGDDQKASLYNEAKDKYEKGWKGNDVQIAVNGVNDFLEKNGEDF